MQPICSRRSTIDATNAILFQIGHNELVLKSTDLEISLQATCDITASTFSQQETFLVPGKRIFDLVRELDGALECSLQGQYFTLKSGQAFLELNIKDTELFPPFPERIENLVHCKASFLLELLDKVAFLIPQNNANNALNGLYIEFSPDGLVMTTTDGHCLAQVSTKECFLSEKRQWLVPRRAIFEIKKIVETMNCSTVFLGVCNNQLVFSGETFNFFTKLLGSQFPNYRTILDKNNFLPAIIDREQFVKTLRRSSCLLSGQFLATRFVFDKDMINVVMENKEVGSLNERIPLLQFDSSDSLDIRFYAPYLLNGLQSFDQKDITCYLKSATKPIVFESTKDEYHVTYLVMPVSPTTTA